MQLRHIGQLTHRTVRLRGIEPNRSGIPYRSLDQISQGRNGQLFSCTYINMAIPNILYSRIVGVLEIDPLQDIDTGIGHLLTPQELTERFTRAPQFHPVGEDPIFS